MGSKDGGDPFKGVDWKAVGGEMQQNPNVKPTIAKRLPKKVRNILDHYFLPRYPLSHTLLFCCACIAAGVGAGMLVETWINKKVKGYYQNWFGTHRSGVLGSSFSASFVTRIVVYLCHTFPGMIKDCLGAGFLCGLVL